MSEASRQIAAGNFSARVEAIQADEIGELGRAFNRMSDSLERLEQLRKSMVSDVAHELRTPLTNLRGYLEGLSDGIIPPDKATFDMLQQENLRLVNLVEDLGQLARADAARAYLDRRPVDLSSCISEMLNLYRMNIDEKQIQVITKFNDGAATVSADRDKLLQAVRNLIDNCLKYTPAGGTVTITSTRTAGDVRVDFINDGPGIPAAELPYVFERFFRAEYSRSRDVGGAGIGLAIVKQLIEAHGGQVGAESIPGETRIWFELPA
jgi:signal transduction histidine kinase